MAFAPSLKASFEPFFPWLRLKPLSKILVMIGVIMGSGLGAQAEGVFDYGIASGDPDASSVVLWTHLSPSDADDIDTAIPVRWEVVETPLCCGAPARYCSVGVKGKGFRWARGMAEIGGLASCGLQAAWYEQSFALHQKRVANV